MKISYNDRQHAYWLDGKRCKGVTTVAKIPDDTYGLDKWRTRQVVIGMATSPPLVNRAAAHFDERDKLDDIAEEAMVAAKAHEASGRGTAAHRITERVDLNLDWIDTPESRAIRQQWTDALDRAGLDIVPELVERIVVYPDQLVAGRFDRIARRRSDGALVVVDVKTGENAVKYPHSTCIQLALYANAPLLAGPLVRNGDSETTETFEPMPDGLDRAVGVIVYLPPEGPADIYELDLTAGWDTARNVCFPTINWRKRSGLIHKIAATSPAVRVADGPTADTTNPPCVVSAERVAWLADRILNLGKDKVAPHWPAGVPTLKQGGLTDSHVDQIAAVLDRLEADLGVPFGQVDPLFNGFATADQTPGNAAVGQTPSASHGPRPDQATAGEVTGSHGAATPREGEPATTPADASRAHTQAARTVLEQYDPTEQQAIVALVVPEGAQTTARHVQLIEAIAGELNDPNGTVMFTYSTLGPEIVATDADDRIKRATGTKTAALTRAKRLARELGHPTPRVFNDICINPTLAALTAAGLGDAEHHTTQETNTQ